MSAVRVMVSWPDGRRVVLTIDEYSQLSAADVDVVMLDTAGRLSRRSQAPTGCRRR